MVKIQMKDLLGNLKFSLEGKGSITTKQLKSIIPFLNKKTFGNSYRRFGKELKTLFVKEWSEDKRHHIHSIIEQPKHIDEVTFQKIISDSWRRTLFGYEQIHIEKPTSTKREVGWLDYIMKTTTKNSLSEAIDWDNSNCFH